MVGNERRKKEAVSRGGTRGRRGRRERGRREGKENGKKKDVGFDVKAERILESSQNEVRPHEPYINQPRLLSSAFPLVSPAPPSCFHQDGPLYLRPRSPPPSLVRSPACSAFPHGWRLPPSWTARHDIKRSSHKALLISYFFLRHVPSPRRCCVLRPAP